MMTLRLEKRNPTRTEYYECTVLVLYAANNDGIITIGTHLPGGEMIDHFIGPYPGQAYEATLLNSEGHVIDIFCFTKKSSPMPTVW